MTSLALVSAGYDRGEYLTSLIAVRVLSLASVLSDAELLRMVGRYAKEGNREAANRLLGQIKGIGPSVLQNFWLLQDE